MADMDAHGAFCARAVPQTQETHEIAVVIDDDVLQAFDVVRDLHRLVDRGVDDRKHADDELVVSGSRDQLASGS